MEQIAFYCRVSTDTGKQDYEYQVQELTRLALQQNYKENQIVVYAEKVSGYQKERPEMSRLLEQVTDNPKLYKCIYVSEISRVGRNPKNTREIVDLLTELGVPLYIQSIGQSTIDDTGKRNIIVSIILQVLMEFADLEAQQMKTRIKSGKLKRANDGKFSSVNVPYGYTTDENGYIVIDNEEEAVIKQIFESYKDGIGTRIIAKTLNEMRIPTKIAKLKGDKLVKYNSEQPHVTASQLQWSDVVIGQILKNTIYKGERKYKGDKILPDDTSYIGDVITRGKGESKEKFKTLIIPAPELLIIAPKTFDECNELLKTKSTRNLLSSNDYLLKDKIICGVCGRKYMGKYVHKPVGDKVYKCTSYLDKRCSNRSINISLIESVFFDIVLKNETIKKSLDNPNEIINTIKKELEHVHKLHTIETKNLKSKEKQIENLLKATLKSANPDFELYGKVEAELQKEVESIKEKIKILNKDVFAKTSSIENFNIEATSKEMLLKAKNNRPELISIFKQFIDKIIINDLGNGYVVANWFIKLNGLTIPQTVKLFIFANGVRKYGGRSEKTYKYMPIIKLENEPVYKDNVLLVEIEDVKNEFDYWTSKQTDESEPNPLLINKFINIDKENWLYINEFDL